MYKWVFPGSFWNVSRVNWIPVGPVGVDICEISCTNMKICGNKLAMN